MTDDGDNQDTGSEDTTRTAHEPVGTSLPPLLAPQRLAAPLQHRDPDRYEHVAEHGRGGLGIVNRVHDKELGRDVAIKELLSRGDLGEIRFLREAMITARLEHPGIVPIHEAGRWPDGTPFYVMKLVAGRSLKELLAERTSIKDRLELLHHVIAVADAVAYAHKRRIIHRDLKASNVIAGDYGETIVIDWGLAKDLSAADLAVPSDAPFRAAPSGELTEVGRVLGTPDYMAPEQLRGDAVDQRADVYAIGVMLWQLCSLERVPPAGPRPRARALRSASIDRDLITIIQKALAAVPADRYQDAGELAEDLRAFKSGARIAARQYSLLALLSHWTRRHRALALTISTALVIALVGTAVFVANIAAERDRADAANNELVLQNASLLMLRDPTAAYRAVNVYRGADHNRLDMLRAEARGRGLAEAEHTPHSDTIWFITGDADGTIYSLGEDRRIFATKNGVSTPIAEDVSTSVTYAYAPEQMWLAYAHTPSGISVVDLKTRRPIAKLDTGTPRAMAMTLNGSLLAVLSRRGELTLWHLPSGTVAFRRELPDATALVFASASRLVIQEQAGVRALSVAAAGHPDATARLSLSSLDATDRAVVIGSEEGLLSLLTPALAPSASLSVCRKRINSVRLAARADLVAFTCQDGAAGVAQFSAQLGELRILHTFAISTAGLEISFGPQDSIVLVRAASSFIHLYDLATGLLRQLDGHAGRISAVHAFGEERLTLLSGDVKGAIRVWRLPPRYARVVLQAAKPIFGASFSPVGDTVLAYGSGDALYRIDPDAGRPTPLLGHRGAILRVRFAPDHSGFLSLGSDKTIRLWNYRDTASLYTFTGHTTPVGDAEYIEGGRRIASVDERGQLLRWSPGASAPEVLFAYTSPLASLEPVPHNGHIVVEAADGSAWDLSATGAARQLRAPDRSEITVLRVSPQGRALAIGLKTGEVLIYETTNYKLLNRTTLQRAIRQVAFDPQERDLLVVSEDGHVRLLPLRATRETLWKDVRIDARDAAYSQDGELIAFVCGDGGSWFYSMPRRAWAHARDHAVSAFSGRFSPHSAAFVSADRNGTVVLRDVAKTFERAP